MNRLCTISVIAALILSGGLAHAVPPTVTPSPGYDARLQEQHKAASTPTSTVVQPMAPAAVTPPIAPPRHHIRWKH